ncbi:MAG: hypothetical protein RL326_1343 [Pseudomonadota bacterium]
MYGATTIRRLLPVVLGCLSVFPTAVLAQGGFTTTGASQLSIGLNGAAPSDKSFEPVSPPNANLVIFASDANNLASNDTNTTSDIFQYSPDQPIQLISVVTGTGQSSTTGASMGPAVSQLLPDGSYAVAFVSNATDLVPDYVTPPQGLNGNPNQVYIRLPKTNETLLVSGGVNTTGLPGQFGANADCDQISITALTNPNRYIVAFRSKAGNLESPPSPNQLPYRTIFLVTLTTTNGKTTITSPPQAVRAADNTPYRGDLNSPSISGDGRWIAFNSDAAIFGSSNGFQQAYLLNRGSRALRMITQSSSGEPGNGDSRGTSVSFQAEKVAFITQATNLLPGALENRKAYQFEPATKKFIHVSSSAGNEASNGQAFGIRMSPNGRLAVFSDDGTNLVTDPAANNKIQTYIKDTATGAVIRASVTAAGLPGDGDSGGSNFTSGALTGPAIAFGGTGFNSRTIFASFRSGAQNLTAVGVSSDTFTNVFRSTITPPKPRLVRNAPIEAPPDVKIDKILPNGKGARVTISFQEFEDFASSATASGSTDTVSSSATKVKYNLEVRKVGSRQQITRTLTRNQITISKLSPGKYVIRYRVTKTSGRSTVKSGYSAKQSVEIS